MKWTVEHYSPFDALYLRLLVGLISVQIVRSLFNVPPLDPGKHWRAYFWAGVGIFPSGALAYWSSLYLPSGVYALIYGLMPFYVLVLSLALRFEQALNPGKFIALFISFIGLTWLTRSQIHGGLLEIRGLILVFASAITFALSIMMTRRLSRADLNMLNLIQGSLLYAIFCFTLILPIASSGTLFKTELNGILGILYLGIFGSVVSYIAYYYLLRKLSAISISVIFLATPIIAVILGSTLNAEQYAISDWFGISLIMVGLLLFIYLAIRNS